MNVRVFVCAIVKCHIVLVPLHFHGPNKFVDSWILTVSFHVKWKLRQTQYKEHRSQWRPPLRSCDIIRGIRQIRWRTWHQAISFSVISIRNREHLTPPKKSAVLSYPKHFMVVQTSSVREIAFLHKSQSVNESIHITNKYLGVKSRRFSRVEKKIASREFVFQSFSSCFPVFFFIYCNF